MKTEEIKKKLHEYIDKASEDSLFEFLSFVEEKETEYKTLKKSDHWDDEEFVKEMERRVEEIESGKVPGLTYDEAKKEVNEFLERLKKSKKGHLLYQSVPKLKC